MENSRILIYGIGINDADYVVQKFKTISYTEDRRRIRKLIWMCPFYLKWTNMFKRCNSENFHVDNPTYTECVIAPEWHYFMTFRAWMVEQDWEGKHLDKDLLVHGNKVYGPNTCVFIDKKTNNFLNERQSKRGEWPIGVDLHKPTNKFHSRCRDVQSGKTKHLGYFDTPEEAHQAWLTFKLEQAKILASQENDPRVAKALIERYENYVKRI